MEGQTRQRLIGTILLLLLAAILAPLLLRGPDEVRVALDLNIPEPPPVAPVEPRPVVGESTTEETDERISEERRAAHEAAQAHGEQRDADGASDSDPESPPLSGWSVQVASFSERQNAMDLEKRLRDAGYNAYWRKAMQEGQALFRVFAGPELEREDARALKRRVAMDEGFGQDGLVVPYEP